MREERRRRFVGRAADIAALRQALAVDAPPFCVMFVHGPGGIGKTALLERLAEVAADAGVAAARLDLKAIDPDPAAITRELGSLLEVSRSDDVLPELAGGPRRVLLFDTYESAVPLDGWFRQQLVPSLRDGTIVVIAGRHPPSPEWTMESGWRSLLAVVPLRNLPAEDARSYLALEEIPDYFHERVLALTHGHPLALSLVADLVKRSEASAASSALARLGDRPDLVRTLLERIVESIPSERHRDALYVCARARFTTEGLLREVLDDADAGDLFNWLRQLSFIEETPRGLAPHDLAREALDADLRWRDAARYAQLHAAIRAHVLRRVHATTDPERQLAVADLVYMNRGNPFAATYWQWRTFGDVYADALRDGDRRAIVEMVDLHEGGESAALAEHWMDRQPEGFRVLRSHDASTLVGFGCVLALHLASGDDIATDPGASAMWAYARREGTLRPGDKVFAARFYMDRDAYQLPSASYNAITVVHTQMMLTRDRSTLEFIGLFADPDRIQPLMSYIDYRRAVEADFEVGGRRYGVFYHDWRRVGVEAWLDLMAEREAGMGFDPTAGPTQLMSALGFEPFSEAVRRALRELHRPDKLATNPLVGTRLVARQGEQAAGALRRLLMETIDSLASHPRDRKLARALDRTYVRPAQTQELAAEALDLPFSTYKRHLKLGVERIIDTLWQREISGDPESSHYWSGM